eukprot:PLAT14794.1.p1 GENE.PLAT14794.1~~PLAT14794.1.p1  ORF type:complete len:509 (-),score=102.74 PLAT14794.1:820-2268(-)
MESAAEDGSTAVEMTAVPAAAATDEGASGAEEDADELPGSPDVSVDEARPSTLVVEVDGKLEEAAVGADEEAAEEDACSEPAVSADPSTDSVRSPPPAAASSDGDIEAATAVTPDSDDDSSDDASRHGRRASMTPPPLGRALTPIYGAILRGASRLTGVLPSIYRSQLSLLPMMLLITCITMPLLRLGTASNETTRTAALALSGALTYFPLCVIPLWVYTHVAPGVYPIRKLFYLLAVPILLLASLRGARQALFGRPSIAGLLVPAIGKLDLEVVTWVYGVLHPLFVGAVLPYLFSQFTLRTRLVRLQLKHAAKRLLILRPTGVGVLMTPLMFALFAVAMDQFYAGRAWGWLAYAPIPALLIGIAIDKYCKRSIHRDLLYTLAISFIGLGLSTSANQLVLTVVELSSSTPELIRTPLAITIYTFFFTIVKQIWLWLVQPLVSEPQLWSPLIFGVQLLEDLQSASRGTCRCARRCCSCALFVP